MDEATCDLSVKNPNRNEEVELREPEAILEEISALDLKSAEILSGIRELVR